MYTLIVVLIVVIGQIVGKKDIVFIIDRSKSISSQDFQQAIDFVHSTVERLEIGSNENLVSIITYSDDIKEEFQLDSYVDKTSLLDAIKKLKLEKDGGGTRTHEALEYVRVNSFTESHGARTDADPVVVLMTDGVSYVALAIRESSKLKNLGTRVFSIGIGSAVADGLEELQAISSDPDTTYLYTVGNFSMLQTILSSIVEELKKDITVTASTTIREEVKDDITLIIIIVVVVAVCAATLILIIICAQKRLHKKEIEKVRRITVQQYEEKYLHKTSMTSSVSTCPVFEENQLAGEGSSMAGSSVDKRRVSQIGVNKSSAFVIRKERKVTVADELGVNCNEQMTEEGRKRRGGIKVYPFWNECEAQTIDDEVIVNPIIQENEFFKPDSHNNTENKTRHKSIRKVSTRSEMKRNSTIRKVSTRSELKRNSTTRKVSTRSDFDRNGSMRKVSTRSEGGQHQYVPYFELEQQKKASTVSKVNVGDMKKTPYVNTVVEINKFLARGRKSEQWRLKYRSVSTSNPIDPGDDTGIKRSDCGVPVSDSSQEV